jgi:Ca2+-binding RTX toxin-like protein
MKQTAVRASIVIGALALLLGGVTASAAPASTTETCFGLTPTIVGTDGDDGENNPIEGTAGDDVIVGLGGSDFIEGQGGDDTICGGPGQDYLFGEVETVDLDHAVIGLAGNDRLDGGPGDDGLIGNTGDDAL